jgi:hypothetical protein
VGSNSFGSSGGGCFVNASANNIEWFLTLKTTAAPLFVFLAAWGLDLLARRRME